ncbi:exonuclease domain-containing protein [Kitasatospora sp. NPDC048545]|uniref:exonuclease domain-containing protein n=1 Tax=Kitasatospora sp. NPDC048545 TaxID=3157208 RepID=UPI00340BF4BF
MHNPWHLNRMAALDFEASDKTPDTARIVSCALIHLGGGMPTEHRTWLVNPGVAQEPEAIAVHGLTDEYLAEHGMPADRAVAEIAQAVAEAVGVGIPLVGHNIGSYDLTLLDRETRRHHGAGLEEITGPLTRVIDTMTLDRHAAPYRRRVSATQGPYQLRTTVETYGQGNVLAWDEEQAHGAEYDAHKAAQAAWVMGVIAHKPTAERPAWVGALRNRRGPYDRFDDPACDIDELHRRQVGWAARDAASLQSWLRSDKAGEKRDPAAVVDGSWPLRPMPLAVAA